MAEIPFGQPCTFKCEDLTHKKEYKFRVKAVNKMGASEPITFNKTILAKDPWGKERGLSIYNILQIATLWQYIINFFLFLTSSYTGKYFCNFIVVFCILLMCSLPYLIML